MSKAKRKPILSDHRKIGKDYLPPLLQVTEMQKVSWRDFVLPELIWLGLLNEEYGLRRGSELGLAVAKAAQEMANQKKNHWYAPISAYGSLSDRVAEDITGLLRENGSLDEIRKGLDSLVHFYPECPLKFIFDVGSQRLNAGDQAENGLRLNKFKQFLSSFMHKYDKPGTLAQANAIYIAFVTGKLKVVKGVSLENFPLVADFPDTEASRRVAASIYPTINLLMGIDTDGISQSAWSQYFWNRGLELEQCSIKQVVNSYER